MNNNNYCDWIFLILIVSLHLTFVLLYKFEDKYNNRIVYSEIPSHCFELEICSNGACMSNWVINKNLNTFQDSEQIDYVECRTTKSCPIKMDSIQLQLHLILSSGSVINIDDNLVFNSTIIWETDKLISVKTYNLIAFKKLKSVTCSAQSFHPHPSYSTKKPLQLNIKEKKLTKFSHLGPVDWTSSYGMPFFKNKPRGGIHWIEEYGKYSHLNFQFTNDPVPIILLLYNDKEILYARGTESPISSNLTSIYEYKVTIEIVLNGCCRMKFPKFSFVITNYIGQDILHFVFKGVPICSYEFQSEVKFKVGGLYLKFDILARPYLDPKGDKVKDLIPEPTVRTPTSLKAVMTFVLLTFSLLVGLCCTIQVYLSSEIPASGTAPSLRGLDVDSDADSDVETSRRTEVPQLERSSQSYNFPPGRSMGTEFYNPVTVPSLNTIQPREHVRREIQNPDPPPLSTTPPPIEEIVETIPIYFVRRESLDLPPPYEEFAPPSYDDL